jgi:sterol desaturase/sphingolipid hydroxylase (fatty acid hydroxylase superfamily)
MTFLSELRSGLDAIGVIVAALALVSILEALAPLIPRRARQRERLTANLGLSALTIGLSLLASTALLLVLHAQSQSGIGLAPTLGLSGPLELVVSLLVFDFSFYVAHVAMHKLPLFWRFHAVHHADAMVDVTTTLRQHPGELLIRTGFTWAFALALGASPASYAVYRSAVALVGLLEHANLRVPRRVDQALALITSWPGFHKVHHADRPALTDSNYGNLFSLWDRLFGTATTDFRDQEIRYGLEGVDDAERLSFAGLLALPHSPAVRPPASRDPAAAPGRRLASD